MLLMFFPLAEPSKDGAAGARGREGKQHNWNRARGMLPENQKKSILAKQVREIRKIVNAQRKALDASGSVCKN